ncbi:transketolase [Listeria immobilis]|uniref:transketolase n=1 Tax=Listeria immobilis TaxID=2713502 RepID=UPI001628F51A|nr:transketolase [Listeria immobilis]MBC1515030.1 transketolase [Listeria immobilis]
MSELKVKSFEIRKAVIKMIYEAKTGHTGSDLSCADILVALYYGGMNIDPKNPEDTNRDRYVQSKGHAVEVLWAVLADKGYIEKEELASFSAFGTWLIGHPNNKVAGIEMNTGSLGHGLSVSVGIALAAKMDKKSYHTYTLLGDGELAEGSVWEGAMAAANYQLDNLTAIIDRNSLQISGRTEDVMRVEPLADKWRAFGWDVIEADGNDPDKLLAIFKTANKSGKPRLVIAKTIKGYGVKMAENVAKWHHYVPSKEEYEMAINDLDERMEASRHE